MGRQIRKEYAWIHAGYLMYTVAVKSEIVGQLLTISVISKRHDESL